MTQLSNVLITDNSTIKTNNRWSKHPLIVFFLRQIYRLLIHVTWFNFTKKNLWYKAWSLSILTTKLPSFAIQIILHSQISWRKKTYFIDKILQIPAIVWSGGLTKELLNYDIGLETESKFYRNFHLPDIFWKSYWINQSQLNTIKFSIKISLPCLSENKN